MSNPMIVGNVVFGPPPVGADILKWREHAARTAESVLADLRYTPCNCIGPQAEQTKCPCVLRAEMEQAAQMLRDGVTIAGKRYRLVPED